MDEKNLMEQLLAESKKRTMWSRITAIATTGILIVVFVAAVSVMPNVFKMLDEIDALADSAKLLVESAEVSLEEISGMTQSLTDTSTNLNAFITDNSQTVSEAISGIDDIDVDVLNEAIQNLHDAVEPFANLMNRFR